MISVVQSSITFKAAARSMRIGVAALAALAVLEPVGALRMEVGKGSLNQSLLEGNNFESPTKGHNVLLPTNVNDFVNIVDGSHKGCVGRLILPGLQKDGFYHVELHDQLAQMRDNQKDKLMEPSVVAKVGQDQLNKVTELHNQLAQMRDLQKDKLMDPSVVVQVGQDELHKVTDFQEFQKIIVNKYTNMCARRDSSGSITVDPFGRFTYMCAQRPAQPASYQTSRSGVTFLESDSSRQNNNCCDNDCCQCAGLCCCCIAEFCR